MAVTSDDLDNIHARSYKPGLGRFLSVDPVMVGINDPQALNRYAYVTNRPTVYTDPTGMFRWPLPWGLPEATIEGESITVTSGKYDLSGFAGFLYWGAFLQNMPTTWGSDGGTRVVDHELSGLDRFLSSIPVHPPVA